MTLGSNDIRAFKSNQLLYAHVAFGIRFHSHTWHKAQKVSCFIEVHILDVYKWQRHAPSLQVFHPFQAHQPHLCDPERQQGINQSHQWRTLKTSEFLAIPSSPVVQPSPEVQQDRQQDTWEKKGQRTNLTLGTKPTDRLATELRPLKPLWSSEERFVWEMYRHQNNCHASRTYLTGSKTVIHSQGPHFPHCWHRAVPTTQQSDI